MKVRPVAYDGLMAVVGLIRPGFLPVPHLDHVECPAWSGDAVLD